MVRMKIDAHQHFWVYRPAEYPWIGSGMDGLARDRLPGDLEPYLRKLNIDGTILVQARQSMEETEFLLGLAQQHPFIKGVVGWVDLCNPRVRDQLERLSAFPQLRGVRHVVQDEPEEGFLLREDFTRGIGLLRQFNLVYDLLIRSCQLPAATALAARFPQQMFVLDHIAKPPIRSGAMEPWRTEIRKLAALDNVVCKLSGMVTEADWKLWRPQQLTPYMEVVLEAFGPRRLMVGSDWPVCTLAAGYQEVMELAADFTARLAPAEQQELWGGTAARIYNIQDTC
jgi:L-fuconolactonase